MSTFANVVGTPRAPYVDSPDVSPAEGAATGRTKPLPGQQPAKTDTRLASATVLGGATSVVTLGWRGGAESPVGWSYGGPTVGSLPALASLAQTGRATGDIALTYYGELDTGKVKPTTAFGQIAAAMTKSTGLADLSLRANMTFRPTTDRERAAGKGAVMLKSMELSPAYENAPDGVFPASHPTRNGAANFLSATWNEKSGWSFSATAATALVALSPGHGKKFDVAGKTFTYAGAGYVFSVPLGAADGKTTSFQASAVSTAVGLAANRLPANLKPVGTAGSLAARGLEVAQIVKSYDAALVTPNDKTPGTVLVVRGRGGFFELPKDPTKSGIGLQVEGNPLVIALTPDRTDQLNVVAPNGKLIASAPYGKLAQSASGLTRLANQVLNNPAAAGLDTLIKGAGVKTAASATVNAGRAVVDQIGTLLGDRQMTAAGKLAEQAVKDGVASWKEIAQGVGWGKLADAVGGWPELANRVKGGWATVAEGAGGWPALAERVGGFPKLAAEMKGWGELAAAMNGWGNLTKAMGGAGKLVGALGGVSGALDAMGEAALLGLGVDAGFDVAKSTRLDKLDLKNEAQAREALGLIQELRGSNTRKLVDAATNTNPFMAAGQSILDSLNQKERHIYALHPQLKPPASRPATQGFGGTNPLAPTRVEPSTPQQRRDVMRAQQQGVRRLQEDVKKIPGFGDEAHFQQLFAGAWKSRLQAPAVVSQLDAVQRVAENALEKADPRLFKGLRTTDGKPLPHAVDSLRIDIRQQADRAGQLIRQREAVLAALQARERQHADHRSQPSTVTDPTTGHVYVDSPVRGSAVDQWGRTLPQLDTELLQRELKLVSSVAQLRCLEAGAYLAYDDHALRARLPRLGGGAAGAGAQATLATVKSLTGELEQLRALSVDLQGRANRAGSFSQAAGQLAGSPQSAAIATADPSRKLFRDDDGTPLGYRDLWNKLTAINQQVEQKSVQLVEVQKKFNAHIEQLDAAPTARP